MGKDIQLTIGMDVGDTYSHLVVLDDHGAVAQRDRVTTRAASIRTWFGRRAKSRVALEVGRHSPWISRLLAELGHEVIVGTPRKIALIHGGNVTHQRRLEDAAAPPRRASSVWCPVHRPPAEPVQAVTARDRL